MRAFVTGSTGLLGNNLVRALREAGWEVRALVRSREKGDRLLADLGVEMVQGDLTEVAGFAGALAGCDVLFHTAAYFREYYGDGDHWARLQAINVDGSLALMRAAHAAGVQRAIDTSSSGIIAPRADGAPSDEGDVSAPERLDNLYFRSKVLSERQLRAFSDESGFPILFVLPGWMFGPGDAAPTASGRLVQEFLAGQLPPVVLPGGAAVADARDVARAMIRMAEVGRAGERYCVVGRRTTLREIIDLLADVTDRPAPRLTVPYAVALGFAWLSETWARLTGGDTLITVTGLRTLNTRHDIRCDKAERELGVTFRPLRETLRDEVAWYRRQQEAVAVG